MNRHPLKIPSLPRTTHPLARSWFRSLAKSGQSQLYQPSDWQHGRLVALLLSRVLHDDSPSAEMWAVVFAGMDSMLDTHAARARAGVEVERVPATRAVLTPIENYRTADAEE